MTHPAFSPKDPAEVLALGIDFSRQLDTGETISGATWSATQTATNITDATPLVLGVSSVTGDVAAVRVSAGTAGCTYKLRVVVVTSNARTLVGCSYLPVAVA